MRGVASFCEMERRRSLRPPARRSQFQFAYHAGSRSRSPCGVRRIASRCLAPLSDHGLALAFPSHAASQDPSRPGSERSRASSSATSGSSSSLVFTDSSFPSLALASSSGAPRRQAGAPRRCLALIASHEPAEKSQRNGLHIKPPRFSECSTEGTAHEISRTHDNCFCANLSRGGGCRSANFNFSQKALHDAFHSRLCLIAHPRAALVGRGCKLSPEPTKPTGCWNGRRAIRRAGATRSSSSRLKNS